MVCVSVRDCGSHVSVRVWPTVSVHDVHDVLSWTVLSSPSKLQKHFFHFFILNAQCPPTPRILGCCPVYISNTGPVLILIFSYTPFGMIICRLPVAQISFYSFNIEHFANAGYTIGTFTVILAAPGLDIQITVDSLCNSDVKISNCKNKKTFGATLQRL